MSDKTKVKILGFEPKENASDIYIKKYFENYSIEIDFAKNTIFFGGKIKIGDKTTQNITKPEDWVVLECVNRLLEKGYNPDNIQLEKSYPAGHGVSKYSDICVTHNDGSEYLLIECKTYGKEFDKEFIRMKKDGGQLFTYFKFSNKPDVIMLYASEIKANEIVYRNEIVKIEEDYKAGDVKDFYEKWNKLTKDNGVFDTWVKVYNFESKALTINDLEEIRQEDSSFIFNRFLEILRHNVVSDKGNAFNRIFTLFLCKIYDEKDKEDSTTELEFQWFESPFTYDGIYYGKDNHISFQIRLTDLYKKGMKAFLEKKVTDLSDNEFNSKFHYLTEEQRAPILTEFKKIRLEKNNEFAIKDVYDEQSFYDNAVVVKEIVELLQKFKIRYTKKQQYLSDFFELLLTTGLKQESGQFFTPVPVAQFVIKSLPLDKIIENKLQKGESGEYLPYIIDYAAGSGHFLTETMHEVQRIINSSDFKGLKADVKKFLNMSQQYHFDWAFDYVYGIEKDYRLVKVGKVGCYLHGDGLANVIHSDGLARFSHDDYKDRLKNQDKDFPKENKQFDIIVSNPPYSVSAFRNNASKYYNQNEFDLYEKLTDNSSEIECLFIERTKQLLRDGGVAGIILPSSILSNTGIYSKSREIILQYFDIVGIMELGSNTFMATGTNTVTLFLRRRNNYDCEKIKTFVTRFLTDCIDNTVRINEQTSPIEKPVAKYVNHVWEGLTFEDYISLLKKTPNKAIVEHEIYKEYRKKIYVEKIKTHAARTTKEEKEKNKVEAKAKAEKEFLNSLLEKEAQKLLYFIIAYPQKVVLVKSGEKDAEKRFLGYEFSNRRGSEGIHPIQRGKNIEECTQLFDAEIFDNPTKASTYIYKAFSGDFDTPIDEAMQNNVSRHNLVDMMTFDRVEFEKNISLSVKKKVKIESRWELVKLGTVITLEYGKSLSENNRKIGLFPVVGSNGIVGYHNDFYIKGPAIIVGRKGSAGKVNFINENNFPIDTTFYVNIKNKKLSLFFCFILLKNLERELEILGTGKTGVPGLNRNDVYELKIPLPPLDIQQKIVAEIEILEAKEQRAKEEVEGLKEDIYSILNIYPKGSISEICSVSDKKENPQNNFEKEYIYLGLEHIESNTGKVIINKEYGKTILSTKNVFGKGDILYGKLRPYLNKVAEPNFSGICSTDIIVLKTQTPKILKYLLLSDDLVKQTSELMKGVSLPRIGVRDFLNQKIPLPPLSEQQKIVSEIEKIEASIALLEAQIAEIPHQKEAVLRAYL